MNRNLIIVLIIVVLTVGLVAGLGSFMQYIASHRPDDVVRGAPPNIRRDSSGVSISQNQKLDNNSKYIEYSKGVLDRSKIARRVLFFYASWCPTCRPTDADLKANLNKFPEDLVVLRVNYNDPETDQEEKDLARKYAVTYQHTFVQIDGQGNEVTTWNGGRTEELLANIK